MKSDKFVFSSILEELRGHNVLPVPSPKLLFCLHFQLIKSLIIFFNRVDFEVSQCLGLWFTALTLLFCNWQNSNKFLFGSFRPSKHSELYYLETLTENRPPLGRLLSSFGSLYKPISIFLSRESKKSNW